MRMDDSLYEHKQSDEKWRLRNSADIKSLADRLDGKLERELLGKIDELENIENRTTHQ